MPSLGMRTVHALKVRRQINPKLKNDGILLLMVDNCTKYAKEISALLRDTYGSKIKVFAMGIPHSVRAADPAFALVSCSTPKAVQYKGF